MIRKLEEKDLEEVACIWLDSNIETHNFISESYWRRNFQMVKEMFLDTEVYVFEKEGVIQGFVGVMEDYIAGIFVKHAARSTGIGKELLDYVKDRKPRLTLSVYQKNENAIRFYQRENFVIEAEDVDHETDEKEYKMVWEDGLHSLE